jgi:hypothetical protein
LTAARTTIAAAKVTKLSQIIYASQILPEQPTGVAILDAKVKIEKMLAASGVPWSSLCIGCYMDEWLGMAQPLFRRLKPVMVSKVILLNYFNKNGYVGNTK